MSARATTDVDSAIGQKIEMYRMKADLSQSELGRAIGVTFQQIQKYENGANRVAASRLLDIARAIGRPIQDFFPT